MFLAADASAQCAEYVMNHLRAGSAVAGKAFQPIAGRLFSWRRGQQAHAQECGDNLRLWLRTCAVPAGVHEDGLFLVACAAWVRTGGPLWDIYASAISSGPYPQDRGGATE